MSKKERGIERHDGKIASAFSMAALILIFFIAFCLGPASLAQAQTDCAIECDGVDDYAYIPFEPPIAPGDTITIQMYINFPDFTYGTKSHITPLRITQSYPPKKGSVERASNSIMPYLDKSNPTSWGAYICKDKCAYVKAYSLLTVGWHHLAIVVDGIHVSFYLDDEPAGQGTVEAGNLKDLYGMVTCWWVKYFHGQIEEIRIYDRALSTGEILSSWSCPLDGDEDGLVGLWKFDEKNDAGECSQIQEIYDSNENGDINSGFLGLTDQVEDEDPVRVPSDGFANLREPPVAVDDPTPETVYVVPETGNLTITAPGVLTNDLPGPDFLTAQLVNGPADTRGQLIGEFNPDGSFIYSVDPDSDNVPDSENFTDVMTYKAIDECMVESNVANINIKVPDFAIIDNCPGISNPGQEDVDFDNIGDVCDNCRYAWNPNQENSDADAFGDACDSCPKENNADTDGDGVAHPCINVNELVVDVAGSIANICFEYTASAEDFGKTLYFVKPTCFNTNVTCWDGGNLVPPADRLPPPVGIVFTGDPPTIAPNQPDVEAWKPTEEDQVYERCVECNLLEMYHPKVLENSGPLTCEAAYFNSIDDSDAPPTLFVGASPQAEFTSTVQFVEINIRPESYPNIINACGDGKKGLVIYGTEAFSAATIDPLSLTLWPDGKPQNMTVCPTNMEFIPYWKLKDIGSPGTTAINGPPDGIIDLLVHFEETCLHFEPEDTKAILGGNAPGTSIMGYDEITVTPCNNNN